MNCSPRDPPVRRLQRTNPRRIASLVAIGVLLMTGRLHAGNQKDFFQNTDMTNGSNYSPGGLPTNTDDVRLNLVPAALTISAANLTMESLSADIAGTFTISNATTGAGDSTLTLGNSSGFTNAWSGVANDLIYLTGGSSLTIQGSNSGTGTGTLTLALASSGNFNIGDGSTLTIGAAITGNGKSVTKTGLGLAILSGANTYDGGTTVSEGTLQLGTSTKTGSIVGAVTVGGMSANATFDIVNANTGGLTSITNNLNGVTNFYSANTADHLVLTNNVNGSTAFNDNSTADNATITNNGGTTNFYDVSTADHATIINSASDSTVGVITFNGNSTAGNATITNNGIFGVFQGVRTVFNQSSTAGNAIISNTNNSETEFHGSSTASNAAITNTNFGLTEFFDNSTAANATITVNTASALYFRGSSTAGNATITTNNYGNISNNGITAFFDTSTAGQARLITTGPVGMLPSGCTDNCGSFGVDISSLTSAGMTAGSIEGGGNYFLGSKQLTVGGNNLSTTVTGLISDSGLNLNATGGSLVKVGTGTLTLSYANSYTGGTTVNGGALLVTNSTGSGTGSGNVTVNNSGMFGGTGTVTGNVIVNSGGNVSPGGSPGTLTIGKNYTQTGGGTLHIEIAGVAPGQHDLLSMGGNASLDGTLQVALINGFHPTPGDTITILTAIGGVNGTFSNVIDTGTILKLEAIYNPTSVLLQAVQGSFAAVHGLTHNQQAVAKNLDAVVNDPRADALIKFHNGEPIGNLPHDFDLVASEELSSIYEIGFSQATIQSLNLQRRMDDIRAGSTGFSAAGYQVRDTHGFTTDSNGKMIFEQKQTPAFVPSLQNRWGIFITGTGQFVNVGDEDLNASGYDITTGGFTLGVDYRVTPNFAIGINGGYARSQADLVDDGRVTVDGGKAGVYATYFNGGFYVDAAGGGGYNSYDTRRTALLDDARGTSEGSEWNALVALGHDWTFGCLRIGPTATFQYTNVDIDSFTEDGSLAPLHFPDQNEDSIRSTVGFRAAYDWKAGRGVIVRPELRASWQHEYGDEAYPIDSRFASGAGDLFTVQGPRIGGDSALVSAGVAVQWNDRVSTYVYYDGQLARQNYDSHNVSGGLRISF